jgi:hypothetical protein
MEVAGGEEHLAGLEQHVAESSQKLTGMAADEKRRGAGGSRSCHR